MAKIATATFETMDTLRQQVQTRVAACTTLDTAAQTFTDLLYEAFTEDIVLSRLYATVPFRQLPPPQHSFVQDLAHGNGVATDLTAHTPVLTLLGTRGAQTAWNDRRRSQEHSAIPLVSSEFVAAIPMLARLLQELGIPQAWLARRDTTIVRDVVPRLTGLFYVAEAAHAVDQQGRKIISAQDFVTRYGVHTVFGAGSSYILTATFVALIIFTRTTVSQAAVERFKSLPVMFTNASAELVRRGHLFTNP